MSELAARHCLPCEGGIPPLPPAEAERLRREVPAWTIRDGRLERTFELDGFADALALAARIGALAEAEGHHPDLHLERYRHLRVVLWTHAAGGLTENDFILAAKVDRAEAA